MKPFEACPQFETCSVNACPLDPARRTSHEGDPEQRCKATRAVRERIAVRFGFAPDWARTPREVRKDAARARWLALPEEERNRRTAHLETLRLAKGTPGFAPEPAASASGAAEDTGE